jgi:hypothetical protein
MSTGTQSGPRFGLDRGRDFVKKMKKILKIMRLAGTGWGRRR